MFAGAESLTCGSPACTDEHSDGTEAKCIAETTQCIHSEGPVCKEVIKAYNEQGSPKTSKEDVKTCHMTGRIEVRGKFTCNHGACVQVDTARLRCVLSLCCGMQGRALRVPDVNERQSFLRYR